MNHVFAMVVKIYAKSFEFTDVAIVSVKGSDYRIHFWYMNKDDAVNIMKDSDLKKVDYYKPFLLYIQKRGDKTTRY